MKLWQFYFLASAAYLAPHTGETFGMIFGAIFCALGWVVLWDELRGKK